MRVLILAGSEKVVMLIVIYCRISQKSGWLAKRKWRLYTSFAPMRLRAPAVSWSFPESSFPWPAVVCSSVRRKTLGTSLNGGAKHKRNCGASRVWTKTRGKVAVFSDTVHNFLRSCANELNLKASLCVRWTKEIFLSNRHHMQDIWNSLWITVSMTWLWIYSFWFVQYIVLSTSSNYFI